MTEYTKIIKLMNDKLQSSSEPKLLATNMSTKENEEAAAAYTCSIIQSNIPKFLAAINLKVNIT